MAILHHRFPGICIRWFIASSSLGTYCARVIYRFFLPCQKRWDRTCGANHFLHLIRWMSATKCCTRLDIKGDSNLHWMCGILPEFLDSNHFRVCLFKWLGFHVQFAWNSLPTMSTGRWICQICVLPPGDAWNYGLAGFAVSEDNDCHWSSFKRDETCLRNGCIYWRKPCVSLHLQFAQLQSDKRSWKVWSFSLLCIQDAWSTS